MSELAYRSGSELAALLRSREVSSVELVEASLERIREHDDVLNAVCTLAPDAVETARAADAALAADPVGAGPLNGLPLLVKDSVYTKGLRSTAGSRFFADFVPDEDATCVARLRAAGAVIVGKTNVPELAYTGMTSNALFGTTRNPWNPRYTPGGSSGGTAAAIAAGYAALGIGSDGGGSIRGPASFCRLVGFKPSYGLIPLTPGFPGWDSILHIGPMTRTVADAALLLDAMAGPHQRDRLSLPAPSSPFLAAVEGEPDLRGLRVAWAPNLGGALVDPALLEVTALAARRLAADSSLEETSGWDESFEWAFDVIFSTESAGYVAERYDERDGVDPALVRRAEHALEFSAVDYQRAQRERRRLDTAIAALFERYDLLLTPATTIPSFPAEITDPADMAVEIAGRPVTPLARMALAYPFNLSGNPACVVPAGFVSDNRPVGLQIVGPRLADHAVLRAARAAELRIGWDSPRPPIDSRTAVGTRREGE